ncbi:PhzF family phenazine biosynthesis isomerase [Balneolaceae bacterium ANBcel3]|nr:PhzF family phenazine biosynthesis isomerase [Balneolaceae bacterium ANBcel3]
MAPTIVRFLQVDAFTRKPFTGNPAGVVLDATSLKGSDMIRIARELNISETVFVLPAENENNDLRIRWFTPTQEVNLCGHATIAAFHALAEEGRFDLQVNEPQSFLVETQVGVLTVDVEWFDMRPYIKLSLPTPAFFPYPGDIRYLCGALGLADIELSQKVKPQITGSGLCYVPVKNLDSLETLEPNQHLLKNLNDRHDLSGFAVVTTDTGDMKADWVMRFFAPSLGIFEDPVTGTANGPMGAFLWKNGFLDKKKKNFTFQGAQGGSINRPGIVNVNMLIKEDEVSVLQIGGEAVTVIEGNIRMHGDSASSF